MDPEEEEFEKTVEWALKEEQVRLTRGKSISSTKLIVGCLVIFLIVALILAFTGRGDNKKKGVKKIKGGNAEGVEGEVSGEIEESEKEENGKEGEEKGENEGKERGNVNKSKVLGSPDQYKALNMMKDPENFYMDDFTTPPVSDKE